MGSSAMLFSAFQPVMTVVGILSCSVENMNLMYLLLFFFFKSLVKSSVPCVIWSTETEALQNVGTSTDFHETRICPLAGCSNSLA
jgi:hypothetical protein